MLRNLSHLFGLATLALAVITAVLDLTRSIADTSIVIVPLGKVWFDFSPSSLNLAQVVTQRYVSPVLWDPVILNILLMPAWLVFLVLSALFLFLGRSRKQNWQRRFGK